MSTVLLVDKLANAPRGTNLRVISCGQRPPVYDGLKVDAVHVTDAATRHPNFQVVAATLAMHLRKAGGEQQR